MHLHLEPRMPVGERFVDRGEMSRGINVVISPRPTEIVVG